MAKNTGLKDKLKKLVGITAKEVEVPTAVIDNIRKQAEAAKQAGRQIRSEKG